MTDAVAVFIPGYRLTDSSTGEPISGATIAFYDAGTTNPQTVYGDRNLTTALGTSVVTDSLGRPTSDGTSPTDVFVGTADYKVVVSDANAVVLETKDNRPGAPVSSSAADVSVTATFPVVSKSLDYAVLAADQNKIFNVNCSSADVTLTLPSAVTVGDGWQIKVAHAGSANQALLAVASASGQIISEGSKSFGGAYALAFNGEDITLTSDGGNWRVSSHTSPFIKMAQGIIPVVSRLATSPVSPAPGDFYLLTGNGGSWSTFATNDIAFYTGSGWVNFTPPSNCGWRVWVQAETFYYAYISSAWVNEKGNSVNVGTFLAATQSVMETATAVASAVLPAMQHFHPGHPKTWGFATVSGGTPTLATSYNMTSITDTAVGVITFTIATDFSSANWGPQAFVTNGSSNVKSVAGRQSLQAAGSIALESRFSDSSLIDPDAWSLAGLGDI